MKAVLVLCLLAFISCEKDIIDIGKCIYKAPKVKELINDAIVAFATKDFTKFLQKLKESVPELIKIIIGCIKEEKSVIEEKPELTGWISPIYKCMTQCTYKMPYQDPIKYQECINNCLKKKY